MKNLRMIPSYMSGAETRNTIQDSDGPVELCGLPVDFEWDEWADKREVPAGMTVKFRGQEYPLKEIRKGFNFLVFEICIVTEKGWTAFGTRIPISKELRNDADSVINITACVIPNFFGRTRRTG